MRCAALLFVSFLTCACGGSTPASTGTPPAPASGPPAVVSLPPPSGTREADSPPEVTVPASAAQVRLELSGVSQPADELMAELESGASGEVRRWPVDAAAGGVSVTVPIYAVPAGEHVLTLWQGDATVVGRHRFRVVVR